MANVACQIRVESSQPGLGCYKETDLKNESKKSESQDKLLSDYLL